MTKINVPLAMLKKFLASKGMRVPPESIKVFEKKFRIWADKIAIGVSNKCVENKRKTILPEDFDEEINDEPLIDASN